MKTTRVGVFGGSFDPPHRGHQLVATQLLARKLVDEVWFLPVKNHPFGKKVTASADRLAMVERMVDAMADTRVKVETTELQQARQSYSYQTLQELANRHPDKKFVWIMGSDQLETFPKWFQADQLVKEFEVVVYPRGGYNWRFLHSSMIALRDWPSITISSTAAREKLAAGQPCDDLVLPVVAGYSKAQHLYI